jgi:hypothetical protein
MADKFARHWWVITGLFFFLATDEILESHEYLAILIREKFNLSGIFWYAWIIPFSGIIILLTLYFYRFVFLYLPADIRKMFIISGFIYIFGALGMEMLGGYLKSEIGNENMTWIVISCIEEGLEMFGIIYFLYTLLLYCENYLGKIVITVEGKTSINKKLSQLIPSFFNA